MEVYTIGFTEKTAEEFFETLKRVGIKRLIDVRLNNTSQLAGFAKRDNLRYFLGEICGAEYVHEPLLAPTEEILDGYKKKTITWEEYEEQFLALLAERRAEEVVTRDQLDGPTVLLCSEAHPERCHRRLVAEYLQERWEDVTVTHL